MTETTESINDKIQELRPLPEGKLYHVFFSYRNTEKDTEWVRNVIKILETQYKFICCDHYVDFLPGRNIMENIKECIKKSVKTVIVLSNDYNKSFYCKNELEFAVYMQMRQKQHIVIPIEKEFCDIPESLEFFTRLDASGKTESWIHRLVAAIEAPVDEINVTNPLLTYQNYNNFDIIHKETTKTSCSGEAFKMEHLCNALCRHRIELNTEILHLLSSTLLINHRLLINPSWPVCIVCYILLPSFLWGGFLVTSTASNKEDLAAGLLLIFLFTMFGIVWPISCFLANRKGRNNIRSCLLAANKVLMPQNVFMAYKISRLTAKSYLMSLNVTVRNRRTSDEENTGLKDTFIEIDDDVPLIGSNDGSTDGETYISNMTPAVILHVALYFSIDQTEVLDLLLEISPEYFLDFISGRLVKSTTSRHCVGEICMCEYWELKIGDPKKRNGSHEITDV